jgi:paraquat-inducible protein B
MSKPVSKTLIGAFVLGALVLVVAALMVFGSGKLFSGRNTYVLYFDGSVKGLNMGSPVMFRGVKVGQVSDINLLFNPEDFSAVIPVYIEVDPGNFSSVAEVLRPSIFGKIKRYAYLKPLIDKGLKAQLQMQSFVTGQLMINLDFYPDRPARFVGLEKKYPEIPTVPTSLEQLTRTLQELNLHELYNKFMQTIDGLEQIVGAPGARDSLPALRHTLKQADDTLALIHSAFRDNAKLGYDMNIAIKELNATARSLRSLADYLDRHPEALIRGKK